MSPMCLSKSMGGIRSEAHIIYELLVPCICSDLKYTCALREEMS